MAKAVPCTVSAIKNQQPTFTKYIHQKMLFLLAGIFILSAGYAQNVTYYNIANGVDGTVLSNWNTIPGGGGSSPADFNEGDTFAIQSGTTVITTAPWTVDNANSSANQAVLDIEGTFTPSALLTLGGSFLNNGTFNDNNQSVTLGTGSNIDGSSATTFNILTINDPTGSVIPIVTSSTVTIKDGGTLNLTNGYFKVGASNTLAFTKAATINVNTGSSDFANANDGTNLDANIDGGTIALNGNSGGVINVNGGATFNNITTAGGDGNVHLNFNTPSSLINGTLTVIGGNSNLFQVPVNSPIWGSASTLSINNNNQAYSPGAPNRLEWVPLASGTIGITPGYPNNVTLMKMGSSAGHGAGFDPTGIWSINGTLSIGNGVVSGKATLEDMTLFTSGGIAINAGSSLRGHNIVDKGNWTRSGVPIGTYTDDGVGSGGTVTFAGSGNIGSPQAINLSSGTETSFANVAVSNNTYVKLFKPVTLPSNRTLTLSSGIIGTSSSNLLTVANTSPSAITGGSGASYVNGPLQWNLAAGSSNSYNFPVGAGTSTYLPFTLMPNTPSNSATVQAFNVSSGGTPDGTTILAIDQTAYWSLTTSSGLNSGSSVSLGKASPVAPFNRIGESATKAGVYTSVGGTAKTFSIDSSTDIGTSSPFFFVMADTTFIIPVKFVDVRALLQGSHALVQWQVADQEGIVAYSIQRSTDDIHFTSIGQVPATALLTYDFTDLAPAYGTNYYRIASIENSSKVDYSEQASVVYGTSATSDAYLSISPNPVTGSSIGIKMSDAIPSGVYIVSLANSAGQNIYNTSITHTAGNTIETVTPTVALEAGTYYLSLSGLSSTGTDKYNLKVVVVH
jgi:methionine-rich copper-binding protein CopC